MEEMIRPSKSLYVIPAVILILGTFLFIYTMVNEFKSNVVVTEFNDNLSINLEEPGRYFILIDESFYNRNKVNITLEGNLNIDLYNDSLQISILDQNLNNQRIRKLGENYSMTIGNYSAIAYIDIDEIGEYQITTSKDNVYFMISNLNILSILGMVAKLTLIAVITIAASLLPTIFIYLKRGKNIRLIQNKQ